MKTTRALTLTFLLAFQFYASAEVWGIKGDHQPLHSYLFHFSQGGSSLTGVSNITVGGVLIDADGLAIAPDGALFAFEVTSIASRLLAINKTSAVGTPIGPVLAGRVVRGACISAAGDLLAIDIANSELLRMSVASGQIVGSPLPLTLAGSAYALSALCDLA